MLFLIFAKFFIVFECLASFLVRCNSLVNAQVLSKVLLQLNVFAEIIRHIVTRVSGLEHR